MFQAVSIAHADTAPTPDMMSYEDSEPPADGRPARGPRARFRRFHDEHQTVQSWADFGLKALLVYTVIGFGYAALHIELMDQLENALSAHLTVFADLTAVGVAVALWPLLLITSWLCGVATCGII